MGIQVSLRERERDLFQRDSICEVYKGQRVCVGEVWVFIIWILKLLKLRNSGK